MFIGCGMGLRSKYFPQILNGECKSDWFEVITENCLGFDGIGRGAAWRKTLKVREKYPIALHGVSLNIGSTDPLSLSYIENWKEIIKELEPCWVSDHLCWTGVEGKNLHDLMPLPYTQEALGHVSSRVERVQEILGQPIALENVSSYFEYKSSELTEWEFLNALVKKTGCRLLLDINNVYVSSVNQGFDPLTYLNAIPTESVIQIHLAGPTQKEGFMIDTHDEPVQEEVWSLYKKFIGRAGPISTLVERDGGFPPLAELEKEILRAKSICLSSQERLHDVAITL